MYQRVQAFGIEKLESRRTRGDLIQVFKAQNGLEDINWHHGLTYGNSTVTTRGNSRKMRRQVFAARLRNDRCAAVDARHNFLTNRVVSDWNKLPEEAVGARSLKLGTTNGWKGGANRAGKKMESNESAFYNSNRNRYNLFTFYLLIFLFN